MKRNIELERGDKVLFVFDTEKGVIAKGKVVYLSLSKPYSADILLNNDIYVRLVTEVCTTNE